MTVQVRYKQGGRYYLEDITIPDSKMEEKYKYILSEMKRRYGVIVKDIEIIKWY